jgi:hypothetical protein
VTISPEKILYLVSAASGNFGDDLISIAWIKKYRERNPNVIIFIDRPKASKFSYILNTLQLYDSKVFLVSFFWDIIARYPQEWWLALNQLRSDLVMSEEDNIKTLSEVLQNALCIHFLGGGYINSIWTKNCLLLQIASHFKEKYSCKLFWTGSSVYPIPQIALFDCVKSIMSFDFISTRDKESAEALVNYNASVHETCDDSFLVLDKISCEENTSPVLILNCQRDLRTVEFFKEMVLKLRRISEEHEGGILYLSALPSCDNGCLALLQKERLKIVSGSSFLKETLNGHLTISAKSHCIVSRFHLHLVLSLAGITGQYIQPPDEYYKRKHSSLLEIGSKFTQFSGIKQVASATEDSGFGIGLHIKKNLEFEKIAEYNNL